MKIFFSLSEPHRVPAEIEALRRVKSPYVVRLNGEHHLVIGPDSYRCLRYEYIDGTGLRDALAAGAPSSQAWKPLGQGLLKGLVAIHEQHLVHRDLKPLNVVLRGGDWAGPVLIDFGLVRLVDETTKTVYPWARGTWPYMAPEQLLGQRAYERADVFAVGVILFEAVHGYHPFLTPADLSASQPPVDWLARIAHGPRWTGQPGGVSTILSGMLQQFSVRRPSARQALAAWEAIT